MKVKYYPYQPHCFAFGGFDMQMINTLQAVINAGVNAGKLDNWSRDNDFDIIHLWGVGRPNFELIDWAKKSGKDIVATILSPYHDSSISKLGYYYRHFQVRQLIHYYKKIDKIIVLNDLQLKVLTEYYKVPISKMEIIPNIVEQKYFETPALDFSKKYGAHNYVLCTGNICPRKNQYNLALACINLHVNLVLIGNILDGEASYGESLAALAADHKNITWIKELPKASEDLVAAYYYCALFALPSKNETQPISALEAMAMRKPLILMDRDYARQSYYKGAILCKSAKVKDIKIALQKAMTIKTPPEENKDILNCKAEKVGESYRLCYEKLVKNRMI